MMTTIKAFCDEEICVSDYCETIGFHEKLRTIHIANGWDIKMPFLQFAHKQIEENDEDKKEAQHWNKFINNFHFSFPFEQIRCFLGIDFGEMEGFELKMKSSWKRIFFLINFMIFGCYCV